MQLRIWEIAGGGAAATVVPSMVGALEEAASKLTWSVGYLAAMGLAAGLDDLGPGTSLMQVGKLRESASACKPQALLTEDERFAAVEEYHKQLWGSYLAAADC